MKFKKDKQYSFLSYTEPFHVTYESEIEFEDFTCKAPLIKDMTVRYELDNFRNNSSYDSPKCEDKNGRYVKANYTLELCYLTTVQGKQVWLGVTDYYESFSTKKEVLEQIDQETKDMKSGTRGVNGYNYGKLKLAGGE